MSKTDYYSEAAHGPHEIFELGNYLLESGITLPNARIAYKTHGTLTAAKDNVVLFPHMWSGTPKAMEIFIGEDRPLNPAQAVRMRDVSATTQRSRDSRLGLDHFRRRSGRSPGQPATHIPADIDRNRKGAGSPLATMLRRLT